MATKPVDFRKGADGLVALVREALGHDLKLTPFRPDTRHNLEGLRLSSSTGYVSRLPTYGLITGAVRRRHWTTEQKLQIIEESVQPGETVSSVARRRGVAPTCCIVGAG